MTRSKKLSRYAHASQNEAKTFPVLPGNMQRSDVERLLRRIAPALGMNDGQLTVVLAMIDETRPSDWTDPAMEPVCFSMQSNIAYLTGKDERTVRRIEKALEQAFGFIRNEAAMNGRRCRYRRANGEEFRQGIVFTPLIEAMPRLISLEADVASGRIDRSVLKQKVSAAKRRIKSLLMELQPVYPESQILSELAQEFTGWPARYNASVSASALRDHLGEVSSVLEELQAFAETKHEESALPDRDVRRYIQDTTQEKIVPCNDPEKIGTAPKRAGLDVCAAQPDGRADCLEKQYAAPDRVHKDDVRSFGARLTLTRLFSLCSRDMQMQVMISCGDRPSFDERDFINAAIDRLHPLCIHPSAYQDAAGQMGEIAAMLCVLLIDRNRFHPVTPIANPGGALRAMTRRHAAGQLNLVQSLFGLMKRGDTG